MRLFDLFEYDLGDKPAQEYKPTVSAAPTPLTPGFNPVLVSVFRKKHPVLGSHDIYIWKIAQGNHFAMKVGYKEGQINVNLPFEKIKEMWFKKEYTEAKDLSNIKALVEASMTHSVPKKSEQHLHKGVAKLVAQVQQLQRGEPGPQVAVIVADYPDYLTYGEFKRIGETGLFHIKLNGGKLPSWAAGDMIAVRPDEIYATWDPWLKDRTVVHKQYK